MTALGAARRVCTCLCRNRFFSGHPAPQIDESDNTPSTDFKGGELTSGDDAVNSSTGKTETFRNTVKSEAGAFDIGLHSRSHGS